MKASPLLRAWVKVLNGLGVEFRTGWTWQGNDALETPDGRVSLPSKALILAAGGASWSRLGSNGAWVDKVGDAEITPFKPANMGFEVDWSNHMAKHFGQPVKPVGLTAGNIQVRAEFVVSQHGIEGGGIYAVSRPMREGETLFLDLVPDLSLEDLRSRLSKAPKKQSLSNRLRKSLKLDPVKIALLNEFGRPLPDDIAPLLKRLPVRHNGPRPMDEAISTAGGLSFNALNDAFMLTDNPGWFAAGEMLDWEAPTGGYLLTACLATGRSAGLGAVEWLKRQSSNA